MVADSSSGTPTTLLFTGRSSVGLERCLDRAEVTGSNPVVSTNFNRNSFSLMSFIIKFYHGV